MGKRGPRPKPTRLKILEGNRGRRPLNGDEPQPTQGCPKCPPWLSKTAKAEWRRVTPELDALGLLALVDRTALAAYCQAAAELEQATRTLDAEGRVVVEPVMNRGGEMVGEKRKAHPAVAMQRDAMARVKHYLAEFGLSPAGRVNLKVPPKQPADPFEDFLGERKSS